MGWLGIFLTTKLNGKARFTWVLEIYKHYKEEFSQHFQILSLKCLILCFWLPNFELSQTGQNASLLWPDSQSVFFHLLSLTKQLTWEKLFSVFPSVCVTYCTSSNPSLSFLDSGLIFHCFVGCKGRSGAEESLECQPLLQKHFQTFPPSHLSHFV